jgi:hypothetical protein
MAAINAETDIPTLPEMAKDFAEALEKQWNKVEAITLKGRDHHLIVYQARSADDVLGEVDLGVC